MKHDSQYSIIFLTRSAAQLFSREFRKHFLCSELGNWNLVSRNCVLLQSSLQAASNLRKLRVCEGGEEYI